MRITTFQAEDDDNDQDIFGLLVGNFRLICGWIGSLIVSK
jgi:hypothetical protein